MKKIKTTINTCFFDFATSRKALIDNSAKDYKAAEVDKECKKIFDAGFGTTFISDERFPLVSFSNYCNFRRNEESDALVYRLYNCNGSYAIETGLYCGIINLGEKYPQLEIQTGYTDLFFKRMLNFCCGIYVDKEVSDNSTESESIYSLLVQYLFLMSLRKVAGKSIPNAARIFVKLIKMN